MKCGGLGLGPDQVQKIYFRRYIGTKEARRKTTYAESSVSTFSFDICVESPN